MIDPKELRCGNYVKAGGITASVIDINRWVLDSPSSPYRVFVEANSTDSGKTMQCGGRCEDVNPIPLTAAVLESCGALLSLHDGRFMITINLPIGYSIDIVNIASDGYYDAYIRQMSSHPGVYVKFQYLHQLQNLYFALTGKELEIDEAKLKAAD